MPPRGERLERLRAAVWARRPHAALGLAVLGLALAPAPGPVAVWAALAAAAGAAWAAPPAAGRRAGTAAAAAALLAAGGVAGTARLEAIDRPARAAPPGVVLAELATVVEPPRRGPFGTRAVVEIDTGPAAGLRALARFEVARAPAAGTRIALRALVREPRSGGGFDHRGFLRSRGVTRELAVLAHRPAGRRGGLAGFADRVRVRAEAGLAARRDPDRAALARGMVLGLDQEVSDPVRDDFRRAGLAHLLAASGQNVMLLCALALPLLAAAGCGLRGRRAALLVLIALYVPVAGAGPSIVRAGVMSAAALVAALSARPASRLYAMILAAAVTLAANPRATADPAWQLSFAAVAGIAAGAGPLRAVAERALPEPRARPPGGGETGAIRRAAADGIAVTLAATLATAPLMAWQFGAVSVAALPANVLALPAVAPAVWVGMLQAVLGQLGAAGLAAAGLLGELQDPLVGWVQAVARRLAEPDWAELAVELPPAGVAAAYGALALALAARGRFARGAGRLDPPGRARRLAAAVAVAAALALAVSAALPPAPPRTFRVDFVDVGQGDATLVRDRLGAAVLFDGGPPEAHLARRLRALGVRRLSAVVATHQSRDHHGGLAEVLRRIPTAVLLDGGDGTRDPTFRELLAEARRRGVRRVVATAGTSLRAGTLAVEVLAPAASAARTEPGADPNLRAVVALVRSGPHRVLLTADAESPALLALDLPRAHAIKVPHHGSADPGLAEVLARVRPHVAAIPVGAANRYGHPSPSTVATLRRRVPHVHRTDRDGTVTVEFEGARATIRTGR